MPDELYEQVLEQAHQSGSNVSAVLAEAAMRAIRRRELLAVTDEIAMKTGGPFTDEERAWARTQLGLSSTPEH